MKVLQGAVHWISPIRGVMERQVSRCNARKGFHEVELARGLPKLTASEQTS